MQDKDFSAAAQLAFELRQPGRLLAVVSKACEQGSAKAQGILGRLVGQLSQEELKLCMEYIRDWNTNSRHCSVAQAVLQAILVSHPPQVCQHTLSRRIMPISHALSSSAAVICYHCLVVLQPRLTSLMTTTTFSAAMSLLLKVLLRVMTAGCTQ